jgi:hypothetical protein
MRMPILIYSVWQLRLLRRAIIQIKHMIAVTGRNPSHLDNLKKSGVTGCHHHNRGSPFNRGTKYKYLLTESSLAIRAAETRVQTYYTLLAQ